MPIDRKDHLPMYRQSTNYTTTGKIFIKEKIITYNGHNKQLNKL